MYVFSDDDTVKNDRDIVHIEDFGNLLKWFGPLEEADKNFLGTVSVTRVILTPIMMMTRCRCRTCSTRDGSTVTYLKSLPRTLWVDPSPEHISSVSHLHPEITLSPRCVSTTLRHDTCQIDTSRHDDTFLQVVENQNKERMVLHIRIIHSVGKGFSLTLDNNTLEFPSLEDLVKTPILQLGSAAPGSKYYAQLRYVNEI